MVVALFYEILLYLLALIALPKMMYERMFKEKYQESFAQRFGADFPAINKGDRPLVWIHAVSMGETKAVSALAKQIKKEYNNPIIVISSVTETGHAEAKRCMTFADYHVYLPFDFKWIISPIVQRTRPDLVIVCETDFWFNFLKSCKAVGAKVALVNGKISERSLGRYLIWPSFSQKLFGLIDKFCVQNNLYADRFKKLGVAEQKIVVTGNLKFDEDYPKLAPSELSVWKEQLGIAPTDMVLVVGSSHDPEELLIIDTMKSVWEKIPNIKVLIVPRHPERFSLVADLIASKHIPYIRYSLLPNKSGNEKIILMDTMGLLRKCYQLADIAIVAGSYTPRVGGHNIIEPCWFGVPVIFGPYMHTQLELVSIVLEYHAGLQVPESALADILTQYFQNATKRKELGRGGERLVIEMRGAVDKTWQALKS
jgi:3-deoxy-D-manno-octulosonic-acid transferase